jgi:hypothetical protein
VPDAKELGVEFIVIGVGVHYTGAPATKTCTGQINFGSKRAFISNMAVPGGDEGLGIAVHMAGTGGPLTAVLDNPSTGTAAQNKCLETLVVTASTSLHAYIAVRASALESNLQPGLHCVNCCVSGLGAAYANIHNTSSATIIQPCCMQCVFEVDLAPVHAACCVCCRQRLRRQEAITLRRPSSSSSSSSSFLLETQQVLALLLCQALHPAAQRV